MPTTSSPSARKRAETTDDVCARFGHKKGTLTVRRLDRTTVLIEGTSRDLRFLGSLLLALAAGRKDCGYQLGPRTAGSRHFTPESLLGLYLHRLPCEDEPILPASSTPTLQRLRTRAMKTPSKSGRPRVQSNRAT
jgi:hypothetical protein